MDYVVCAVRVEGMDHKNSLMLFSASGMCEYWVRKGEGKKEIYVGELKEICAATLWTDPSKPQERLVVYCCGAGEVEGQKRHKFTIVKYTKPNTKIGEEKSNIVGTWQATQTVSFVDSYKNSIRSNIIWMGSRAILCTDNELFWIDQQFQLKSLSFSKIFELEKNEEALKKNIISHCDNTRAICKQGNTVWIVNKDGYVFDNKFEKDSKKLLLVHQPQSKPLIFTVITSHRSSLYIAADNQLGTFYFLTSTSLQWSSSLFIPRAPNTVPANIDNIPISTAVVSLTVIQRSSVFLLGMRHENGWDLMFKRAGRLQLVFSNVELDYKGFHSVHLMKGMGKHPYLVACNDRGVYGFQILKI